MRILEENEINYSIDDIAAAVEDDLGFTMVPTSETKGYFMIGSRINLRVDFDNQGEVKAEIEFPVSVVDLSDNYAQAELYSSAIESATQIVNIIRKMTGEGNEENHI